MAQLCPKCTADDEAVEGGRQRFCIHEKVFLAGVSVLLAAALARPLV